MDCINYKDVASQEQIIAFDDVPEKRSVLCFKLPNSSDSYLDGLSGSGWTPCVVENANEAVDAITCGEVSVGLVIFDCSSNENYLKQITTQLVFKGIKWVALVSDACVENKTIRQLIAECFFDYHRLPIDPLRLVATLGHAHGMAQLEHRCTNQQMLNVGENLIIGNSSVMQQFKNTVARVARVEAPVLITGESGTGKELAAHAVHNQSERSSGPLELVNCAALPASLIQSELFGHEKGAFTGATHLKIGRFEAADGGTIFLDEIGDLSLELQINLLRILEQKVVRRVGGTRDVPIDVRVVAATHVDLERGLREGTFREDLYYRLNVLRLSIPPLRKREGDIELLARYFLKVFSTKMCGGVRGFTTGALKAMRCYSWPGNVRELINSIQQAVVLCDRALIGTKDLGLLEYRSMSKSSMTLDHARAQSEKKTIISALGTSGRNVTLAAKHLNVSRATVYRLIDKYGIEL
jgi:DNA-binding NtrC family response regulator